MKLMIWKRSAGVAILMAALLLFTGCTTTTPTSTETTGIPETATVPETMTVSDATTTSETTTVSEATTTPQQVELPTFNAEELAKYNGKDGNPAYVAVDGKVYDVSDVPQWNGGSHAGGSLSAGMDQSEAIMRSPHGKDVLSKLPIVGLYK